MRHLPTNGEAMTEPEIATAIAERLRMIREHWWATSDPMRLGDGSGSGRNALPGSTIVLRADVTHTLAFWVHALVDEWPSVLQSIAGEPGALEVVTTTIDCTDVVAMCELLERETERLAEWQYAESIAEELRPLALAVRHVAKPPRRESVTIGDCRSCGHPVKVRVMQSVPVPTTDPAALSPWTSAPAALALGSLVKHPCGLAMTIEQWHYELVGTRRLMRATDITKELHSRIGVRADPTAVRQWMRQGHVTHRGQANDGQVLYDLHEVLAYVVNRDATHAHAG